MHVLFLGYYAGWARGPRGLAISRSTASVTLALRRNLLALSREPRHLHPYKERRAGGVGASNGMPFGGNHDNLTVAAPSGGVPPPTSMLPLRGPLPYTIKATLEYNGDTKVDQYQLGSCLAPRRRCDTPIPRPALTKYADLSIVYCDAFVPRCLVCLVTSVDDSLASCSSKLSPLTNSSLLRKISLLS